MLLKSVTTDTGRGRAWIRSSLNEHSLERYIHHLISDTTNLSFSYESWAFLRDEERASMLPTMASGLSSILFAITIDNIVLNETSNPVENCRVNVTQEIIAHKKTDMEKNVARVEAPAELWNNTANNHITNDKSTSAKKKKRKKPSQIVLFDKDELRTTKPVPKSTYAANTSDQTDTVGLDTKSLDAESLDNEISLGEEASDTFDASAIHTNHDSTSFDADVSNFGTSPETPSQLLNYASVDLNTSVDNTDALKEVTLQEKMKKGIEAVRRSSRKSSIVSNSNPIDTAVVEDDITDIYFRKETTKIASDSTSNVSIDSSNTETTSYDENEGIAGNESGNKSPPKLTPMKNSNVGALIPIASGSPNSNFVVNKVHTRAEDEIMSDDSISIKSFEEEDTDYATACNSIAGSNIVSPIPFQTHRDSVHSGYPNENSSSRGIRPMDLNSNLKLNQLNLSASHGGFFSATASIAASSVKGSSANSKASSQIATISREELKQALLSVMSRKDELQEQCSSLKKLLDEEAQKSASLKEEIELNKRKAIEIKDKQDVKITSLTRENELLKHQLKKYVSAVMKLRDGPQAYETLAKLEGDKNENNGDRKYVDYHFEASEFEKKLIQVAEMHGELLEFNEHLQKIIQGKDAVIRRLKEELVDVRGPLPGNLSLSME